VTILVLWCTGLTGAAVVKLADANFPFRRQQIKWDAPPPQSDRGSVVDAEERPGGHVAPDRRGQERPAQVVNDHAIAAEFHDGSSGTYRTYCVRLCDGYFWPVSFSTTRDYFARDAEKCEQSCDSPARLFVHPIPESGPNTMRSLKGLPYTTLSTAFQFRVRYNAQCQCRAQPWEQSSLNQHRLFAAREAARRGDADAASALKDLAAIVDAEKRATEDRKAAASSQAERELTALAQATGAKPLAIETRKVDLSNDRLTKRLGASTSPGSASSRPNWAARAFSGN
jgi:Protein of unknown function (DUF2865)